MDISTKTILGRMEADLKAEGWGQEGNIGLNGHEIEEKDSSNIEKIE